MRKAKLLSLVLCASMVFSLAACGSKEEAPAEAPAASEETEAEEAAPAEMSVKEKVESALEGMTDEEIEEAWKNEPAYGKTMKYWIGAGCTAAPNVAEAKGWFEEVGIQVEGFKGESDVEALGTDQVQIAIGHIAKATVPATNGVNVTFVGAAHLLQGCKALYVLADSEYQCYEDLKGTSISVPNGIGASDYNITARLLIEAGMNPLEDVNLTPVEVDACVAAMQNGEIQAALLGEAFGYKLCKEGILRKVDSKDGNSTNELCCIIMMNPTFMEENPITSVKLASVMKKSLKWMGENPEEATKLLIDLGLNSEDYDMNLELNSLMSFGQQSDEYATAQMRSIIEDYVEYGLITATDDVDAVCDMLWNPIGSAE